nr:PEPxxWA-CTERM sorting domain-containing protein [Glacieibacterium frigidum]
MKIALAALALIIATPSLADTVVINGDTTGGSTYNRPLAGTPPSSLSGVGTAVRYDTTAFSVSSAGSYTFTAVTPGSYDGFLTLYSGSFDPGNALANAIVANDDINGGNFNTSGFTANLLAGTSYFAVQTGFDNLDFGSYVLTIAGPGTISVGGAVPEPAAWALMIGGFGLVGNAMRRRRPVTVTA